MSKEQHQQQVNKPLVKYLILPRKPLTGKI